VHDLPMLWPETVRRIFNLEVSVLPENNTPFKTTSLGRCRLRNAFSVSLN
jgi:hypothetical protein